MCGHTTDRVQPARIQAVNFPRYTVGSVSWEDDITDAWKPGDELPLHNDACVICGTRSASSPLLSPFSVDDDNTVSARVRFDHRHQGAPHYAHGGMVAALLDDACGYMSFVLTRMFVTAHLEVDYRRPVVLEQEYRTRAWCESIEGRKVALAAELLDDDGVVAEGRGLFVTVDIEHFRP